MPHLDTGHYVTLIAAILTSSAALLVGYMHRRQVRQIEAFRQNPAAGLTPPPNALQRFYKNPLRVAASLNVIALIFFLVYPLPLTRFTVLNIVVNVCGLFLVVLIWLFRKTDKEVLQLYQMIDMMMNTLTTHVERTGEMASMQGEITKALGRVVTIVDKSIQSGRSDVS